MFDIHNFTDDFDTLHRYYRLIRNNDIADIVVTKDLMRHCAS